MNISISQLKLFKACRRAWEFRYLEKLEPVQKAEALEIGSNYHEKLEKLYKGEEVGLDFSRETAMFEAYKKYVYPELKLKAVEEWFETQVAEWSANDWNLVGRIDGITEDGRLVEHKTTSLDLDQYEYDLQWDEQHLTYMLATGLRTIVYAVVKKPTIRQKTKETDEEFFNRMVRWYDEDTHSKIRLIEITRTDEEIEQFKNQLSVEINILKLAKEHREFLYKNTYFCTKFGGHCEYASICLNYDPNQEYVEFRRKTDEY